MFTTRRLGRRSFLALSAAGALSAGLGGCGYRSLDAAYDQPPGDVPKEYAGRVRVVFWTSWGGKNGKALTELVGKFNKSQDEVYVEAQFQGSYDDTAQKIAAALVAGQAPDIGVFSEVTWERFYLNDALEPLDGYFSAEFRKDAYIPKLFAEGVLKGRSWWVPFARSTPMFYFNRDAFAKAGLPDRAPATWSELREWGPALLKVESAGRPLRAHAVPKSDGDWQFQGVVWQFGGAYSNGLDVTIGEGGAVDAAEWQRRLLHDDKLGYMATSPLTDFSNGLVATAQDSTGALTSTMDKAKFEVGAGFVPSEVASGVATGGGGLALMRNTTAERKQASVKFLAFLARPENAAWWTTKTGYLPAVTAATEDDGLKKLIAKEPNYGVSIAQLPRARQQDHIRLFGRNSNVEIYTGLQRIYAGNANAKRTFTDVAGRLDAIAEQVRRQYEERVL